MKSIVYYKFPVSGHHSLLLQCWLCSLLNLFLLQWWVKISQVASTKYKSKLFTLEFQIHVGNSNLFSHKFYFIYTRVEVSCHKLFDKSMIYRVINCNKNIQMIQPIKYYQDASLFPYYWPKCCCSCRASRRKSSIHM